MAIVRLLEIGLAPGAKREIPVTGEEFLIGRGTDCDLRLGDSSISRHHCLLRVRGEEVAVVDLGSSNGTYLNGLRVLSQAPLHNGSELRLGELRFLVEVGEQGGISWCISPGADPALTTRKIGNIKEELARQAEKERGHPPGEAGGQGDPGERQSG